MDMAGFMADTLNTKTLVIEPEMLDIIAELDEFKGAWRALSTLATIESIGSSTRIEGSKLSDQGAEGCCPTLKSAPLKRGTSMRSQATPASSARTGQWRDGDVHHHARARARS